MLRGPLVRLHASCERTATSCGWAPSPPTLGMTGHTKVVLMPLFPFPSTSSLPPPTGQRKLYLCIEGSDRTEVQHAKLEVLRILDEASAGAPGPSLLLSPCFVALGLHVAVPAFSLPGSRSRLPLSPFW